MSNKSNHKPLCPLCSSEVQISRVGQDEVGYCVECREYVEIEDVFEKLTHHRWSNYDYQLAARNQ